MLNLLWFLLPVAAAAGWFAARRSGAARPEAFWDYASNFHEGLNVLLNERHGSPTDLFDSLSDTDRDTADTHIALGNLYRRRGDVERAILLHESLLEKAELGDEVHASARLALAHDYSSAGLLDRSEKALRDLIESGHRKGDAYKSLLQLHERERDWGQAISVAEDYQRETGDGNSALVAHYYCELSAKASEDGYTEEARTLLDKALSNDPESARANIMIAELALASGDAQTAIDRYARVEQQRPDLMPETIEQRFEALCSSEDTSQLHAFVKHIRNQRNAYSVVRKTRDVIEQIDGRDAADKFFKQQVLQRPSLKGLRDWVSDQVPLSRPGEREKVQVILQLLDQVTEDKPTYQCSHCGFQGNVLHWRCPSCGTWDSVRTIIGVEGE